MTFNSKEELMDHATNMHGIGKQPEMESKQETGLRRIPIGGAVLGGVIGGIVMAIIPAAGGMMLGTGAAGMFMMIGMGLGAGMMTATLVGLVLHFVVAIVTGLIFGISVYAVKPFRKISSARGLGLGALYGIIVYLVFFLPMAMKVLAPTMMHLMGPKASMILGTVLAIAFIGHLLYGLILGFSTFFFARPRVGTPRGVTA